MRTLTSFRNMPSSQLAQLIALILIAFSFGGGGVGTGIANLVVQVTALAIAAFNPQAVWLFFRRAPKTLVALASATCVLPLLQIVPLPPEVWVSLPGREVVLESLRLIGEPGWFSFSVDRARTLVAFLGIIAPFVVLCLGLGISRDEMLVLHKLIVFLGIICALFGMVQLLGFIDPNIRVIDFIYRDLYREPIGDGHLNGTFGNRNSTGIFLVSCLVLLCCMPGREHSKVSLGVQIAAGFFLILGIILTQSRSSMALISVPALLLALRVLGARHQDLIDWVRQSSRSTIVRMLLLGVLAASLIVALLNFGRIKSSLSRFDSLKDIRPQIWEDSVQTAAHYWPVGSGVGTFDEVFQIYESLEYATAGVAGRAHNDYLEVAVESGIVGLLLVAGWLIWFLASSFKSWRFEDKWLARGASGVIICLALQSLVDYPLRNQSMLCIAAVAVAMLVHATRRSALAPT